MMTRKQYDNLPTWQKEGMLPCVCGSRVALFYDENENYRVECCKCKKTTLFKARSMKEAKEHWKTSPHCAGLGICDMNLSVNPEFTETRR